MKKILMLLEKHFPEDQRVEKEAVSLINAGHEVHMASMCTSRPVAYEEYKGIHVHRKYIGPWLYKTSVGALKAPFYHNYWRKFVREILQKQSFDVIHVHDLPLARVGYEIQQEFKLKFVLDLHEDWAELLSLSQHTKSILGRILSSYSQWKKYELEMCKLADRVIVVIDEGADRLVNLGISESKVLCVSNTISLDELDSIETKDVENQFPILGFAGGVQYLRGLQYVVKALPIMLKANPNIKLWVVGGGRYVADLKEMCRGELEKSVHFFGHLSYNEMMSKIQQFDIGLIPHLKSPYTDTTIPNKLFQYMYMEKPILTSDCNPLERIVEETNSGLVYAFDSEQELADKALKILANKTKSKEYGRNGKAAVMAKYNWDVDANKLVKLYQEM